MKVEDVEITEFGERTFTRKKDGEAQREWVVVMKSPRFHARCVFMDKPTDLTIELVGDLEFKVGQTLITSHAEEEDGKL
jgi:hypothetical protein